MKKIILSLSAALLLTAIPSFAQNTQKKANEINAAGKSATQSQSATDASATQNEAWDGSAKNSGTAPNAKGGQIDIIGGNAEDSRTQEEPSTFDNPETEDVTPWKTEMYAMMGLLGGAFLLMMILSIMISLAYAGNSPGLAMAATIMAGIATAMCAAALALALVLIIKYKQTELGITWAIVSTLAMTFCLVAAFTGVNAYKGALNDTYSVFAARFAPIGCIVFGSVMTFSMFYAVDKTGKTEKKELMEYCQTHPDYQDCDRINDEN